MKGQLAGNVQPGLSASVLKSVAIVAMVVDHLAAAFLEYYSPLGSAMHFVGRLTGPIMFYFIAEGYHKTGDKNRYTMRLFLFAVVSYLPFIYFKTGTWPTAENWNSMNVIYTLFLGHLALRAVHEISKPLLGWAAALLCILLSVYGDWGYFGVIAILTFDMLRGNLRQQQLGFCLLVLLGKVLPPLAEALKSTAPSGADNLPRALVNCGLFLPALLLGLYSGQRGRAPKWLFYVFYPAHLLVLGLLKKVVFLLAG